MIVTSIIVGCLAASFMLVTLWAASKLAARLGCVDQDCDGEVGLPFVRHE
ncbi:hypothetical protein UFOVP1254_59 [uncultured Caudovirales phage]|uniref:Uncharacterized protein n=1 Tax=uncultured Caudovirales phage TaxID=2100421 RepID=A0A6J5RJS0_9CAUD|nr:hypothetical protein UFOVP1254_59 [uncultured Caudovirales phage]